MKSLESDGMSFSLATLLHHGAATPSIEVGGAFYPLAEAVPSLRALSETAGLLGLLRSWPASEATILKRLEDPAFSTDGLTRLTPTDDEILTPIQYPSKVVLIGANYQQHVSEDVGNSVFNKDSNLPLLFLKPPTTSLVGSGRSVRYPVQTTKLDWELELAVIIGRAGRHIRAEDAMDYVAGYTIGLDLTARDWQLNPRHAGPFDMVTGKAFDDSCPLGPKIVPARFVDHRALELKLYVDGDLKQDGQSGDMTWSLPEIIEAISEHMTLEPGDVLMTGTPAGVGLATGSYLSVGSRLVGEITGLGKLVVEVIPDNPGVALKNGALVGAPA
jgi:2-keto-4-pentenoate hydratase/2-oxohepta-3-ene-1,7-dioic acid hydratase in catechol pathway